MSLGLVLVFLPVEAVLRHDVVVSETSLCCLCFLLLTLISAAQVRTKETNILRKHSSQRHSTQCQTKKFSLYLLRHHHISIIFNGQRPWIGSSILGYSVLSLWCIGRQLGPGEHSPTSWGFSETPQWGWEWQARCYLALTLPPRMRQKTTWTNCRTTLDGSVKTGLLRNARPTLGLRPNQLFVTTSDD